MKLSTFDTNILLLPLDDLVKILFEEDDTDELLETDSDEEELIEELKNFYLPNNNILPATHGVSIDQLIDIHNILLRINIIKYNFISINQRYSYMSGTLLRESHERLFFGKCTMEEYHF